MNACIYVYICISGIILGVDLTSERRRYIGVILKRRLSGAGPIPRMIPEDMWILNKHIIIASVCNRVDILYYWDLSVNSWCAEDVIENIDGMEGAAPVR